MKTVLFLISYGGFFVAGVCLYLFWRSYRRLQEYEEMIRVMKETHDNKSVPNWKSTKFSAAFELDDIIKFDSKTIQDLIKEHRKNLPVAFFGFSEELKKKILENMSENARGILEDDIRLIGQVNKEDLERVLDAIKWTAWALSPLY